MIIGFASFLYIYLYSALMERERNLLCLASDIGEFSIYASLIDSRQQFNRGLSNLVDVQKKQGHLSS